MLPEELDVLDEVKIGSAPDILIGKSVCPSMLDPKTVPSIFKSPKIRFAPRRLPHM
jgi:hypothetical protein